MIDAQIKYTKARSLSEVLNTAFNYLRLNIKSISILLLYYVLPFFVLSMLASYYFNTSQVSLSNFIAYVSTMFNDNVVEFTVTIAFYFIGLAMQNHLINKHLILNEDLNSDEQVNEKQFRSRLVEDFLQYFSNVFFLALTGILIALLLDAAIGNFLVVNFTYTFSEDPISFIFEALPLLIYLAFVMPLSCYFIVTCLFFAQRNKTGYVEALKKAWYYTRDNLFMTWATTIIAFMLAYVMVLLLTFPFLAIGFVHINLNVKVFVFMKSVTTYLSLFATAIFQVICIFHLTSLEEIKEGTIIKQKIDNL